MKCTLLGFKSVSFTDSQSGELIEGVSVFVTYPESNTIGQCAEKVFFRKNVFEGFGLTAKKLTEAIGCAVDLEYGPKNKVVGFAVV